MPAVLRTVYLHSGHSFSRRLCEAEDSAVRYHPCGDGADGHTMDGLWEGKYIKVSSQMMT